MTRIVISKVLPYYKTGGLPDGYVCSTCRAKGIQLFRLMGTVNDSSKYCCQECIAAQQTSKNPNTGQWVPALPDLDCDTCRSLYRTPHEKYWWFILLPVSLTETEEARKHRVSALLTETIQALSVSIESIQRTRDCGAMLDSLMFLTGLKQKLDEKLKQTHREIST